ncbi:Hypothetical predicted protein [Olea europaea subsp. europaea]|uniref:Uncharacterized protein n=1 Tax=Olea europaea subsp. europaea TaxID=158383 RepID=A0A8S0VL60_OLEEU|nr:Hypothetical predicted protein [Olea europaea subsp. europaea]
MDNATSTKRETKILKLGRQKRSGIPIDFHVICFIDESGIERDCSSRPSSPSVKSEYVATRVSGSNS